MKILHTSDWHLGHCLYNYDRTEEHVAMIEQIIQIATNEQPDLFLLSGDVFHTSQPSAAVQTLFAETLVRLHTCCPDMTIVATAGNHDSGSRHEIFRTPWKTLNIHTIGILDKEAPDSHIIEIPDKGYVVAVPYCYEHNIPDGFFQDLLDNVGRRNTRQLPVILSAHTTVQGCDFSGHEQASEFSVGGIDTYTVDQLGTGYDYLALGHIHHAQFIHTGNHNVRYSGTPVAVSFDEAYPHSVSIVTIESHGQRPEVKEVEINNPHPLVTLPTNDAACWDEAKQLLKDFPDDIPAYIRLKVQVDDFLPAEANAEAAQLTQRKACRFCHISVCRNESLPHENATLSIDEFQETRPIDIFRQFVENKGLSFDDELQNLFQEALRNNEAPETHHP